MVRRRQREREQRLYTARDPKGDRYGDSKESGSYSYTKHGDTEGAGAVKLQRAEAEAMQNTGAQRRALRRQNRESGSKGYTKHGDREDDRMATMERAEAGAMQTRMPKGRQYGDTTEGESNGFTKHGDQWGRHGDNRESGSTGHPKHWNQE